MFSQGISRLCQQQYPMLCCDAHSCNAQRRHWMRWNTHIYAGLTEPAAAGADRSSARHLAPRDPGTATATATATALHTALLQQARFAAVGSAGASPSRWDGAAAASNYPVWNRSVKNQAMAASLGCFFSTFFKAQKGVPKGDAGSARDATGDSLSDRRHISLLPVVNRRNTRDTRACCL